MGVGTRSPHPPPHPALSAPRGGEGDVTLVQIFPNDEFFDGLRQRGYVDGRTIDIAYLSADNNGERYPALIDKCLHLQADIIAVTTTPAELLVKHATHTVLPAIYGTRYPVTDAGGLMAYVVNGPEVSRDAAGYVDRLSTGAKVAELPVQQATKFELILSMGRWA